MKTTDDMQPSPASACAFDFEAYRRSLQLLAPGHVCPKCGGAGFTLSDDGRSAYYCACHKARSAMSHLRRQGLDQAARSCTFDSFIASAPWQQKMLSAALAYVQQEKPGWLFLGGQSGCGKTHLGTAASVFLALQGRGFVYMPWSTESARLKALAVDERRAARMQELIDADVLYIDDLFKSPPTEADKHMAFEILSARYTRDDRPTIISSERTLAELIAIDEALAGRIAERCGQGGILSIARDVKKNHRFAGLM